MISSQRSGPSVRSLFARTRTVTDGSASAGAAIRILIVDDVEAWHCIYTEVLLRHANWNIVGIARNSVEAVQKSGELNPDVILLDVGLGRVDRLEAARQIRAFAPQTRFLLLGTAESSQLVEMAASIGADGCVSKRDVVLDLAPAVEAISDKMQFRGRKPS